MQASQWVSHLGISPDCRPPQEATPIVDGANEKPVKSGREREWGRDEYS